MKITLGSISHDCIRAVRNADSATLHLQDGNCVELSQISDWSAIQIENGDWETPDKADIPLPLRAGIVPAAGAANSYRRSADGFVIINVAVAADTAAPLCVADLPEGFRPTASVSSGDITIQPDGGVWASGGMAGSVCFYG